MTEKIATQLESRTQLALKLSEPEVVPDAPWGDDVLGRKDIASRLTKLIQNQKEPFVISIDGGWGTGKTFLLKRWQASLKDQGVEAIYFNAWEDDFCDDPLLAILGQMSEHFKGNSDLERLAKSVAGVAIPLLKRNVISVLEKHTGLVLEPNNEGQSERDLLAEYLDHRATKDRLKKDLGKLASAVLVETGHPLVFIVDELDRCRPTFAIELLERVKHVFDVPNLVFVFGVNRDELCSALQSVYGRIDATVYLRRFFDMDFLLPDADSASFCRMLMARYELGEYFKRLDKESNFVTHANDFQLLSGRLPNYWGCLGLSLRDMDYCVRMIALAGKNLGPQRGMFPWLLGFLVALKLESPTLYRRFIQGDCYASEAMNNVDRTVYSTDPGRGIARTLDIIEAHLYRAESKDSYASGSSSALGQLTLLAQGIQLTHPEYLSERTRKSDKERVQELLKYANAETMIEIWDDTIDYVAQLIDLHRPIEKS